MNWEIGFSRDAERFLKRDNLRSEIVAVLINFLKRMKGESVNVDVENPTNPTNPINSIAQGWENVIKFKYF